MTCIARHGTHRSMVCSTTQSLASTDTSSILHQVSWLWQFGNPRCLHCVVLVLFDISAILAQVVDDRLRQYRTLHFGIHAVCLCCLDLDDCADVVSVCRLVGRIHVNLRRATFMLLASRSGRMLHQALLVSIFGYDVRPVG